MSRITTGQTPRIALAAITVAAVALVASHTLFARRIAREIDALLGDARSGAITVADCDLGRLPDPVRRWLRYSGVVGTMRPTTVRLKQEGEFRLDGRGWMPFAADQYFTIDPPGFLWKASFEMAPMVSVTGRDRYQHGEGSIEMRLGSLLTVARKRGGGLNQGAMLRFLGEIQWFPAAALADYIEWQPVDAQSARATMTDGHLSASMTFTFAADRRVLSSHAMRYNDSRGRNESWVNLNRVDTDFNGIRIPSAGEAQWEYESGTYPYIRWQITAHEAMASR